MSLQTADILSLVFGVITIFMTVAIDAPQLYSILKTKNTSGTSLTTYILFTISGILWTTWAILLYLANMYGTEEQPTFLHLWTFAPAIISNILNVFLVGLILFLKVRNLLLCKKQHITELQLSKQIYDKQKNYSWIRKFYPFLIICFVIAAILVTICLVLYFTYTPFQYSPEEAKKLQEIVMAMNIAAAVFFEAVSWPQFIKILKYKDTSGLSLGWAIFLPLSCYTCLSYDIFLAITTDVTQVIASLILSGCLINTAVLILKIRNMVKAKKLGLSEWTYTSKYISSKAK